MNIYNEDQISQNDRSKVLVHLGKDKDGNPLTEERALQKGDVVHLNDGTLRQFDEDESGSFEYKDLSRKDYDTLVASRRSQLEQDRDAFLNLDDTLENQGVTTGERFALEQTGMAGDAKNVYNFLKTKKGYKDEDLYLAGDVVLVRNKETGKWGTVDPEGLDSGDVGNFLASAGIETAGTAAVAYPLTRMGIPAPIAVGAGSAAVEAGRQFTGKQIGTREEYSPMDVAVAGGMGAGLALLEKFPPFKKMSEKGKEFLSNWLRQRTLKNTPYTKEMLEDAVSGLEDPADQELGRKLLEQADNLGDALNIVKNKKGELAKEISVKKGAAPTKQPKEVVNNIVTRLKKEIKLGGITTARAKEELLENAGVNETTKVDLTPVKEAFKQRLIKAKVLTEKGEVNTKTNFLGVAKEDVPKLLDFYNRLSSEGADQYGNLELFRDEVGSFIPSGSKDALKVRAGLDAKADAIVKQLYADIKKLQNDLVPGLEEVTTEAAKKIKATEVVGKKFGSEGAVKAVEKGNVSDKTLQELKTIDELLGTNFVEQIEQAKGQLSFAQAKKLLPAEKATDYRVVKALAAKQKQQELKLTKPQLNMAKAGFTPPVVGFTQSALGDAVNSDMWKKYLESRLTGEEE